MKKQIRKIQQFNFMSIGYSSSQKSNILAADLQHCSQYIRLFAHSFEGGGGKPEKMFKNPSKIEEAF